MKRIEALRQELKSKKSFVAACQSLSSMCEEVPPEAQTALQEAGKVAFTVLQCRFSNPKFWQAGLDFFLALEFHLPESAEVATWRDKALEEVDDEARARAKEQARLRRLEEDRMHNKGRWSDAATPLSLDLMLASQGLILVQDDDKRPAMSRDARHELRVVTVMQEDVCVVCQEAMPQGSKAKSMPCGHLFHDDCLITWVEKNNSCPTCRFDELPSEKKHFDDVQRRIEVQGAGRGGLYS